MGLSEIFAIIIIHYIADFIFQDEKWVLGKSKNMVDLLSHTITYSAIWFMIGLFYIAIQLGVSDVPHGCNCACNLLAPLTFFTIITFILHTITDYFTSRVVSKKFANGEYGSTIPNIGAFSWIGGDQVLHYIQLFTTYYLLINM